VKIPIQEEPRATPRPIGTPYSEMDRSTGLEDVAKGLDQLGAGAQQYMQAQQRAQNEADAFRVDQADLQMGKALNENLYNKDTGFLNQQGEKGLDSQPTFEAIEKARKSISEGLANDKQRKSFELRAQARTEQARVTMERHSYEQRLGVYKGVADGQAQLALDSVAADPSSVDTAVGKVLIGPDGSPGPLRRYLTAQGLPPEAIQADEAKFRAQAYTTAIQTYLNAHDWQSAEGMFTKVEGQLGPAAKSIRAQIGTLKNDTLAEATAMKLVGEATAADPDAPRVDDGRARKSLDAMPEGPLKDEARKRLESRLTDANRSWKELVDSHFSRALTGYETAGWAGINYQDKTWLLNHAPEEYRKLDQYAVADSERKKRVGRERFQETDAERNALTALRAEIASDPDRFKDMSSDAFISQYHDGLSPSGQKVAGALFAATKKEPKGSAAEFTRYVVDERHSNPALKSKAVGDEFSAFMGDRRREFRDQYKREPNLDEMETMKTAAFKDFVTKGLLWDTHTPAFRVKKPAADASPDATPAKEPSTQRERPDFTGQYNTKLSPTEEHDFQAWVQKTGKSKDLADYDLRGAWKAGAKEAANGHLPDTFKKPNHPTFSQESQYQAEGLQGGSWKKDASGKWSFIASQANVKNMGADGLRKYFAEHEPNVKLVLPNGPDAKTGSSAKVEVTNGKERGLVNAAKLDTWLQAHPGWRKK
jgi:hypothetical protein